MRDLLVTAALAGTVGALTVIQAPAVEAQAERGQVWIQIEAKNSRAQIASRLQAWAETLPQVQGFVMASGWYAAALGPYDRPEAEAKLAELKLLRAIPSDSFIADPRLYRGSLEAPAVSEPAPLAAPPAEAPISGATGAPADPVAVTPLAPAISNPAAGSAGVLPTEFPAETLAEARAGEAALSREERMEIQRALVWVGTLSSGVDGAFGPATRGAISAWQEREGQPATGVLTSAERGRLLAGWQAEVAALGLEAVHDDEAGIALDLPLGLVEFREYAPPFAKYHARGESGMQIWLISQPGDAQALAELYDQLLALPMMPGEGLRARRARGFEITGVDAGTETQAWAELSQGAIKGYLVTARRGDAARTARVLQAMRGSFRALPGQVLDPGLIPLEESVRAGFMTGVERELPKRAGSGFFADTDGLVMTAASVVEGCRRITLDRGTEVELLAANRGVGAALLRPLSPLAPQAVAQFAARLPAEGSEVAVAGYSFGTDLPLPSVTFGRFEAATALDGAPDRARLSLPALEGDIGAAVLGNDGRVIGVLEVVPPDPARQLPDSVAYLAPSAAVLAALGTHRPDLGVALGLQLPAAGLMAPEDLRETGTAMAVQVLCWE